MGVSPKESGKDMSLSKTFDGRKPGESGKEMSLSKTFDGRKPEREPRQTFSRIDFSMPLVQNIYNIF